MAVLRALRKMTLPGDWRGWRSSDVFLFNATSLQSQIRRKWLDGFRKHGWTLDEFKTKWPHHVERAHEDTAEAIRWRDADEAERQKIRDERSAQVAAIMRAFRSA